MSPIKQNAKLLFKIFVHNLGNGMLRPILKVEWVTKEGKTVNNTSLLLENGDILQTFVSDLIEYNTLAYNDLITFSKDAIEKKYPSVHRIICNATMF